MSATKEAFMTQQIEELEENEIDLDYVEFIKEMETKMKVLGEEILKLQSENKKENAVKILILEKKLFDLRNNYDFYAN